MEIKNGSLDKKDPLQKIMTLMLILGVLFLLMASIGSSLGVPTIAENKMRSGDVAHQRNLLMKAELGAPVLISPNDIAGTKRPKFIWEAVEGADQYILKLKYPNGTITLTTLDADAVAIGSTCEWSWPPEFHPLEFGSYVWWVQAKAGTSVGSWSTPLRFQITGQAPGKAIPILPSGLTSMQRPVFTWSAASGATGYIIEVDLAATGNGNVFREDLLAEDVTSGPKCHSVSPIPLSGDYFWRVQAYNDFGKGNMSPYRYFTIVCPAQPGTVKEKRFASRVRQDARKASSNAGGCRRCNLKSNA